MRRALDELVIEGVQTTIPLHRRIFRDADFIAGRVDTTWVERVLLASEALRSLYPVPIGACARAENWAAVGLGSIRNPQLRLPVYDRCRKTRTSLPPIAQVSHKVRVRQASTADRFGKEVMRRVDSVRRADSVRDAERSSHGSGPSPAHR